MLNSGITVQVIEPFCSQK